MLTFLERIEQLTQNLRRYDRLKEERNTIEALRTRKGQVAEALSKAERALNALVRVEAMGGKVTRRPRLQARLRAKPAALAKELTERADELAHDPNWGSTLLDPLETFSTRVSDAAKDAWQELVDTRFPPVKDEVFKQLDQFQTQAQIDELRVARERLQQLRAGVPVSNEALAEVEAVGNLIRQSLQQMQNLPRAVQLFLAKAVTYQATAEDFTVEVQHYLRDNHLLALVRIGLEK
jgi:DNA repair exonuclease SbcCD ATPase subunit